MYYQVTIGYETEDLQKGIIKKTKSKYLFQAQSAEEATILAAKYASEDDRHSEVLSVNKFSIEELITSDTKPEYYK